MPIMVTYTHIRHVCDCAHSKNQITLTNSEAPAGRWLMNRPWVNICFTLIYVCMYNIYISSSNTCKFKSVRFRIGSESKWWTMEVWVYVDMLISGVCQFYYIFSLIPRLGAQSKSFIWKWICLKWRIMRIGKLFREYYKI